MKEIKFSEPLTKGRLAYEKVALLQQKIASISEPLYISVDLSEKRTGLSFVFLLACLHYHALEKEKDLSLTVDAKTFSLMQQIRVPGIRDDGQETKAKKTGFRQLVTPEDVVALTEDIWKGFPVKTSTKLGDALKFNIGEVFNNASGHAKAGHIIGGWHTKPSGIYCFSCYDTGMGIPENINRYREANGFPRVSDGQAVRWAMRKGNSTSERVGAGLGLDLLRRFSMTNGGAIRICSGGSLYRLNKGVEEYIKLDHPFHGTFFEMDIVRNGLYYFFKEEEN